MSIVLDGTTGITTPDINTTAQSTDIISTGDIEAVDATLSGGVYLGGTGAANYLDDYEEGTFTPTIGGTTSDPTGVNYGDQYGKYTKVGNLVTVGVYVSFNTYTGGSGNIRIKGLPFLVQPSVTGGQNTGAIALEKFVLSSGYTYPTAKSQINDTSFIIFESGSNQTWQALALTTAAASSGTWKQLIFSSTYFTNA